MRILKIVALFGVFLISETLLAQGNALQQLEEELDDEIAARLAADSALQASINDETNARLAADADLANSLSEEVAARISDIDTEEAARIADVNAEEVARISADNSLQTSINDEIADRLAADANLVNSLSDEVVSRTVDVDTEEAARIAADNLLQNSLDFLESQIEGLSGSGSIEVIMGPSGVDRNGQTVANNAAADCRAAFGSGARWATSEDLIKLSWDSASSSLPGWVNWYPILRDASGYFTDRSGWFGPMDWLACGYFGTDIEIPWNIGNSSARGFCANRNETRPHACTCDLDIPAICVAFEQ